MGFTTSDPTDPILSDFISDQQAFLEQELGKTFSGGDDGFEFARSVVTDLSAMRSLVRLTGGSTRAVDDKIGNLDIEKGGQLGNRPRVIFELRVRARDGLAILERDARKPMLYCILDGAANDISLEAANPPPDPTPLAPCCLKPPKAPHPRTTGTHPRRHPGSR